MDLHELEADGAIVVAPVNLHASAGESVSVLRTAYLVVLEEVIIFWISKWP